jgi:formate dehydrogenase iron-sulfur subunit
VRGSRAKEWNAVPDDGFTLLGSSYDNTGALGRQQLAARRLHRAAGGARHAPARGPVDLGMPTFDRPGAVAPAAAAPTSAG